VGYDIHRLVAGRRLILGGVEVAFDRGLTGHSDGDVLLHAVIDALLGACNLPDIGETFPDTDPKYKDVDSKLLLAEAVEKVRAAGFFAQNVDCIVHAERPKLSGHKQAMAGTIALLLGLDSSRVSVKAKTAEGLGPCGTSEAIAATVVASVVKES
jgi:2-C-methyl-D-erythritol 2,4-cyclodiphosphate synthase